MISTLNVFLVISSLNIAQSLRERTHSTLVCLFFYHHPTTGRSLLLFDMCAKRLCFLVGCHGTISYYFYDNIKFLTHNICFNWLIYSQYDIVMIIVDETFQLSFFNMVITNWNFRLLKLTENVKLLCNSFDKNKLVNYLKFLVSVIKIQS